MVARPLHAGRAGHALRWSVAALTALALHGAPVWLAVNMPLTHAEAAAGAPETAIMVDLAAMSVAPDAPAIPLQPSPEPAEPRTDPPPQPAADTPEPEAAPRAETEAEPEQEPEQQPQQPAEIAIPELPALPSVESMLPATQILPPPRRMITPREAPKPRLVRRKPVDKPRRARPAASPPPASRASQAPTQDAEGTAAQPSPSAASWRRALLAHLNRYKRFPDGASPGVVHVRFRIDGQGRVLSAHLIGSSGHATLDAEAVAMIRRASPVPVPPAGLVAGALTLQVPVRYTR